MPHITHSLTPHPHTRPPNNNNQNNRYQGRPHWGKNFGRTYTHPKCPVRDIFNATFDTVLAMQAKWDPKKVFQPVLFDRIVKRQAYVPSPGCALRNECYCTADEHCGPDLKCIASAAMPEYKVCHFTDSWKF